jgi:hypothetical protein
MAPTRLERRKDTLQVGIESAATHAGRIAGIVAGAVRDVTRELGEFATDLFEMREAAERAEADRSAAESIDVDGPPIAADAPTPRD